MGAQEADFRFLGRRAGPSFGLLLVGEVGCVCLCVCVWGCNREKIIRRLGAGGGLIPANFLEFFRYSAVWLRMVEIWGNPYPPWPLGVPTF